MNVLQHLRNNMEGNNIKDYGFTWNLTKFFGSLKYISEFRSPKIRVGAESYIQFCLIHKGKEAFHIKIEKNDDVEISLGDCEVSATEIPVIFNKRRFSELPGWLVQWQPLMKGIDGDLVITLQIFLREHCPSNSTMLPSEAISCKKLSRDMKQMLNTGKYSDLKLVAGTEEFKVHKAILFARAPNLIDILELKSNDSRTSCKKVSCVGAPDLKLILRYLYTGELDINQANVPSTLSATLDVLKLDILKSKLYAYPNHTTLSTHMVNAVHSFVWPIENFSDLLPETVLSSPIIYSHSECELQLRLRKESILNDNDEEDIVQISIALDTNCERESCHLHFDIHVVDVLGDCTLSRSFDMSDEEWYTALSIKMSEKSLHPKDTLSLYCKLTIRKPVSEITGSDFSSTSLSKCCASVSDLSHIGDDLIHLFHSGKYSDLTVQAGAQLFKVHKALVAARAPKLLESFGIQITEMNSFGSSSAMSDIEPYVLKELFEYIYSGKAVLSDCTSATKLYLTAYKYDLSPLKVNCLSYIKSNITF